MIEHWLACPGQARHLIRQRAFRNVKLDLIRVHTSFGLSPGTAPRTVVMDGCLSLEISLQQLAGYDTGN